MTAHPGIPVEKRVSSAAAERERIMLENVVAAAGRCIERIGLESTTVEDIAAESGISRATLYRKFGNKEGILTALVVARSAPFESRALKILMGQGSLESRVERAMLRAVLDIPDGAWLGELFKGNGVNLFASVYQQRARVVLGLILQSEEARPHLDLEEVVAWGLRELAHMVSARPWNERRLRERIRHFVLPVLIPDRLRTDLDQ